MTDDLHDIDDLFRDRIEGYTEEVPATVWDAVDKDLDRKQAFLYKNKYHTVKRLALLLLLLCTICGAYVIIDLIKDGQTGTGHQKIATMPLPDGKKEYPATKNTEPGASNVKPAAPVISEPITSEHGTSEPATDQPSDTQKNKEQKDNTAADVSAVSKAKKQGPEPANGIKKDRASKGTSAETDLASTYNEKHGQITINKKQNKSISAPEDEVMDTNYYLQPRTVRLHPDTDLSNYITPQISLLTLPANHKNILPQLNKVVTKQNKVKNSHEISLSVFAAPNFNFDRLEDDHHLAEPGRNREEAHKKEQDGTSLSAGLLLNYTLNKKLSIQSGAAFTYSSTAIAPKTIYAKTNNGHISYELNCSSGNAYIMPKSGNPVAVGDSANTSGTLSKLTYITIPAYINYRIGIGNFSLLPALGTGLNILLSGKAKTQLQSPGGGQSIATSISGLKRAYMDAQVGLGMEYGLSRKVCISLRPNVHLAIMSINRETPVKSYQDFLSIETGVRVKL